MRLMQMHPIVQRLTLLICFLHFGTESSWGVDPESAPVDAKTAIAEIASGDRRIAYADWWGFQPDDSTAAIQTAIDSGAPRVVVPFVGRPWIVRPITLRSNLELVFDPGVLILAKEGEFPEPGDSLFTANDLENITITAYGAVWRMRKKDYQAPPYKKGEWRMGLRIQGCKNVTVSGLRIESSGGDGFYLGSSGKNRWAEGITLRDCAADDNHRQGLSITSGQNILVENCVFSNTRGTPPEAGIDLEPDSPDERLSNCVIRNCTLEGNAGHGVLVYLKPLTKESHPVSVRFENCVSRMGKLGMTPDDLTGPEQKGWSGFGVGAVRDDGPQGLVEFINCTAENTGKEGAKVFDKSADGVRVRYVNCRFSAPWVSRHREYGGPRAPILIHVRRDDLTKRPGGVDFIDCHVYHDLWTAAIRFEDHSGAGRLTDVQGRIFVHAPHEFRAELGSNSENVRLEVKKAE